MNVTIVASGVWLLLSALLWRHGGPQLANTLAVGAGCVILGMLAMRPRRNYVLARYLVAPLATWLFVSSWTIRSSDALTVANHLVVASVLLGVALLPTSPEPAATGPVSGDELEA